MRGKRRRRKRRMRIYWKKTRKDKAMRQRRRWGRRWDRRAGEEKETKDQEVGVEVAGLPTQER